jgi:hypothetical protein
MVKSGFGKEYGKQTKLNQRSPDNNPNAHRPHKVVCWKFKVPAAGDWGRYLACISGCGSG